MCYGCMGVQDREISRLRNNNFQLKKNLPDIESLCREVEAEAVRLAEAKAEVARQQELAVHLLGDKNALEQQVTELKQKAEEVRG